MMFSLHKRGASLGEWDGGLVELIPLGHNLVEVSEIAKVNCPEAVPNLSREKPTKKIENL